MRPVQDRQFFNGFRTASSQPAGLAAAIAEDAAYSDIATTSGPSQIWTSRDRVHFCWEHLHEPTIMEFVRLSMLKTQHIAARWRPVLSDQREPMTFEDKVAAQRARAAHRERLPPIVRSSRRMQWRFQAYRALLKQLGHGDGMAEVIELANRDFLDAARASGEPSKYLLERSRAQKIVVHELDMDNLPGRAATLYIVGAFQQLEGFVKDLVDESDEVCGRTSRTRNSGESALDWALERLPGGRPRNIQRIGIERYLALEYYRAIRNGFMHPSKSASSLGAAYLKAFQYRELYQADFDLVAPNEPKLLTLDDFLLFTRIIKYVATDLCRIAEPSHSEIEANANRLFAKNRTLQQLTWETISREKAELKVKRHFKRYDYDAETNLVQKIVSAQFAKHGRE